MRPHWIGLMAAMIAAAPNASRQPVLVELFTSEGCSSCPPADALLEKFDRDQPFDGAQIIALSEHVDYWNYIGWNDPYSSPAFSERQQLYARRLGFSGPYTPQMIVDGRAEFVGSDGRAAEGAIRAAARQTKLAMRILPSGSGQVTIEVDPLPAGKTRGANIYLAEAMDSGSSDVLRGENKGRKLRHVSVVRKLRQLGAVSQRAAFQTEISIRSSAPGSRLVVFAQEPENGPVWGAALYRVP